MSLERIAQVAEVSIGTVSKAFSNSREISEKTRQKIFDCAKELGYFEKYYRSKRSVKVIAVICPELESPYYTFMVSLIESKLQSHGFLITIALSSFNAKKESELVKYFTSTKCVDGIIIISACSKVCFDKEMPIVAVNTRRDISEVDCINAAYKETLVETIAYLKECGHTKIAFIGETLTKRRQRFFLNAMRVNQLEVNNDYLFIEKVRFEDAGKSAIPKLLALEDKPTAILCAYDDIALGAMQTLHLFGKKVPDDFSIVGIDDIPVSSYDEISLTSIKINRDLICNMAVDLLLKKLESKFFTLHERISIKSELVIRNSVKKIN